MISRKVEFVIFVVIFAVLAFVCSNLFLEIKVNSGTFGGEVMIFLLDCLPLLLAAAVTCGLYFLYRRLFIERYVKRIRKAIDNNDVEEAERMKAVALERQPNITPALLVKYKI